MNFENISDFDLHTGCTQFGSFAAAAMLCYGFSKLSEVEEMTSSILAITRKVSERVPQQKIARKYM